MTLAKPEGEGKLHADVTGDKPQASRWCVSTTPTARRTVRGNEKLQVDEAVTNQATRTAIKYNTTCAFCHQFPSFLLVKAN